MSNIFGAHFCCLCYFVVQSMVQLHRFTGRNQVFCLECLLRDCVFALCKQMCNGHSSTEVGQNEYHVTGQYRLSQSEHFGKRGPMNRSPCITLLPVVRFARIKTYSRRRHLLTGAWLRGCDLTVNVDFWLVQISQQSLICSLARKLNDHSINRWIQAWTRLKFSTGKTRSSKATLGQSKIDVPS